MAEVGAEASDREAANRSGWTAVAACAYGLVFGPSVILIMCFGVIMPQLNKEFGWSLAQIGFGASIISIVVMCVAPIQGMLVDRFGVRKVVLTTLPVWAASLMLMAALPPRLGIYYLACGLLPVASLGLWTLSFLRVPATWFDARLGIALGVANLGPGIGASVVPLVLAGGFAAFGWRLTFVLLGGAVLVFASPVLYAYLREGSVGRERSLGEAEVGLSVAAAVGQRPFWLMAFQFLTLGAVSTGLLVHQLSILTAGGIPPSSAIGVQALVGLSSIVGRLLTGWLLDRLRTGLVGALIFATGAVGCALLSIKITVLSAMIAGVSVGFLIGAEFDLLAVLIRRYQGLASFGRIYGLVFAIFQLGGAIGAAGLGFARSHMGEFFPALHAFIIASTISALLFFLYGPYRFAKIARSS